jgi:hypothetical protein
MWEIEAIVRSVIWQLVSKDYDSVVRRGPHGRSAAEDIRRVIEEYGRTLVMPPASGYEKLIRRYPGGDADDPTWRVDAPLWTKEEGRSDLEIRLTIVFGPGDPKVTLRDVLVP